MIDHLAEGLCTCHSIALGCFVSACGLFASCEPLLVVLGHCDGGCGLWIILGTAVVPRFKNLMLNGLCLISMLINLIYISSRFFKIICVCDIL